MVKTIYSTGRRRVLGFLPGVRVDVPSSFSSSAGAASPPAAAPPAAAGAAAPPPEPTFTSKSLMSLPSRACVAAFGQPRVESGQCEGERCACSVFLLSPSYLGEDGGPDWLDILDAGGLDQGLQLVGLQTRRNVSAMVTFASGSESSCSMVVSPALSNEEQRFGAHVQC